MTEPIGVNLASLRKVYDNRWRHGLAW